MATSYRRLPLFDPLHPCYAGDLGIGPNPKLIARVKAADVVVAGRRAARRIADAGLHAVRHSGAADQARACPSRCGGARPRLHGRIWRSTPRRPRSPQRSSDGGRRRIVLGASRPAAAHADYLAWTEHADRRSRAPSISAPSWCGCARTCPADTILCNGAGNYAAWIHRFYRFRRFATHIAPTSASMGYGMPAAVAMKRLYPDRTVISLNGDGDFLMNGQEFATAVQYDLPIVVIVCDNGIYGTIRMHQEREYPGRVFATDLHNPDFAAYARAFGGFGVTVERTEDFAAAFGRRTRPASRRSCTSRSIPRRSRPRPRCRRSAPRRWRRRS